MLLNIATAECFTHGIVGREIHAFSRGYPLHYPFTIDPERFQLTLIAGLFIPTLSAVKSILAINPPNPVVLLNGVKVYDQEGDYSMAVYMAESVRVMTGAHFGIGTSAGIGKGGIAIISNELTVVSSSCVYADLRTSDPFLIFKRQESGINVALGLLEDILSGKIGSPEEGDIIFIDNPLEINE